MNSPNNQITAPSRELLVAELRVFWELAAGVALWPLLQKGDQGDGHPVLVLPGLMANDGSTILLRRFLTNRGYDARGWGLGLNLGPRKGVEANLLALLDELYVVSGQKVSIVGWSLGGVYARLLAHARPSQVRSVITLGSPFTGNPRASNAWKVYEGVSGQRASHHGRFRNIEKTPSVPTTSIYSRSDGIVAWQCSVEQVGPHSENIEVVASHLGLGVHPAVLHAIADRLMQPEGDWRPFERGSLGAFIYPDASRAAAPRESVPSAAEPAARRAVVS